jgi:hypothetical protein
MARSRGLGDVYKRQPYTFYTKIGKVRVPLNLGRLGEAVAWPLAIVGIVDDIHLNKKGKDARGSKRDFPLPFELIGGYLQSLGERSAFQGITKNIGIIKKSGSKEYMVQELVKQFVFSQSSLVIPWKAALGTPTRLLSTPVDNHTFEGVIYSNMPIVGPMLGKPALNSLGDPIGDTTFSGKLYREGFPLIVRFPQTGPGARVYKLILQQGRGPTYIQRGDLEEKYGVVTPDQFYEFTKVRGQYIKEEMNKRYDTLRALDPKQFGKVLTAITTVANARAAKAMGLRK